MKHILSIFKKFILGVLIIIVLLAIQANLDLKLPDYTASIINVGIQQSGITDDVPKYLSISTYDSLKEYLDRDAYELKDNYYVLKNESVDDSIKRPFMYVKTMELSSKDSPMVDYNTYLSFLEKYDETMISQMNKEFIRSEYIKAGINVSDIQMSYIWNKGLYMLLIALVMMACAILVGLFASRIGAKFAYLLREKVVNKIMSFSNKEFKEFSVSSLITRSTNDIQQIQNMFVMVLRILIYAPIIGIGALLKVIHSPLNWVLALGIGLISLILIFLFIFAMPKFKMIQKLLDKLNLVTRERLTGIAVIKAFGTHEYEEKKFSKANNDLANTILFIDRTMGTLMPTITFIMNGLAILIIWVGARSVQLGTIQIGTLKAFITYSIQVIMSFIMLSMLSIILPRAYISIKRIAEVLNKDNSILENDNPLEFKNNDGTLEFKNVSFRYPDADEKILRDISFKVEKGTTTAFIGSTGSGKSTLIQLIPRFYDVTDGEIIIDGINVKDASIKELRDKIGYVPQKGMLFSGTIQDNVMLGCEKVDLKIVKKACEIAQASSFIDELDGKYKYEISEGGTNVSGGQRQRLAIARAIAKRTEILIFDDSFSALDAKTDANLRHALHENVKDVTILIVAQKISSILDADQIIVLDEGRIVGKGTHQELISSCKIYQEIASSQLKGDVIHE